MTTIAKYSAILLLAMTSLLSRLKAQVSPLELATTVAQIGAYSHDVREAFLREDTKAREELFGKREQLGLLAEIQKAQRELPREFSVSLISYEACCDRLLRKTEKALEVIVSGLQGAVDTPELLDLKTLVITDEYSGSRIPAAVSKLIIDICVQAGRILPISMYARFWDESKLNPDGLWFDIDPPPPGVPRFFGGASRRGPMAQIPRLYEQMGCTEEAIACYLEAIYSGADLGGDPMEERNQKAAKLWLRVAELEGSVGHYALAFRAYLKAAYEDDELVQAAADGVAKCLAGEPKPKPVKARLDKGKVKQIAQFYDSMNICPLALALLERTQQRTGWDLSAEKKRIEDHWQAILASYRRAPQYSERLFFGLDPSEVTDWGKAKILRPSDTFWKPAAER